MPLPESGEMYLESIYILRSKLGSVRSLDVAEYMKFSKPSVSRAVGLLRKGGYIVTDRVGLIELTEEGERYATKIYERHTLLSSFLQKLGVSAAQAAEDACKMEHDLSDETFDAIKKHIAKYDSIP